MTSDGPQAMDGSGELDEETIGTVARLVRERTGFPVADYKPSTIHRRIARRMSALALPSAAAYAAHLEGHPDEAWLLVQELLVSVTSFFRDPEAFAALGAALANRTWTDVVRCWVPGCATGEEAYSLALLLDSLPQRGEQPTPYLIFATDMDEDALKVARAAHYPAEAMPGADAALADVRITDAIRSRVVFARHNVIEDPPFTRIDLVSCRNLLIYLNPGAQRRVLESIHYALRPGGLLLLGKWESPEAPRDGWEVVDPVARLFRRRGSVAPYAPRGIRVDAARAAPSTAPPPAGAPAPDARELAVLSTLAARFAPPSVVIDESDQLIELRGATAPFLRLPEGPARLGLFDLLADSLAGSARALLLRARASGEAQEGGRAFVGEGDERRAVRLAVTPFRASVGARWLVSFLAAEARTPVPAEGGAAAVVHELERELDQLRADLGLVVRELAASQAELTTLAAQRRNANEELQSANEELQSANEELQSTNEELLTVNEELRRKTAEADAFATDLVNVEESIGFPILVVDGDLRVTQANKACRDVLASSGDPMGASLTWLAFRFEVPGLADLVRAVLAGAEAQHVELPTRRPPYYHLHVRPYRADEGTIAGAVLIFDDVTDERHAQAFLRTVADNVPALISYWDAGQRCRFANRQYPDWFGVPEERMAGIHLAELLGEEPYAENRPRIEAALRGERQRFERTMARAGGDVRHLLVQYLPDVAGDEVRGFHVLGIDVTALKEAHASLATLNAQLRDERDRAQAANRAKSSFLAAISHEIRTPLNSIIGFTQLLARDDPSPTQGARLAKVHAAADHLLSIINDLLDLSRIEAGELTFHEADFQLDRLLAQLADLSSGALRELRVELRLDIEGVPGTLHGDELRVRQALLNFLGTALRGREAGPLLVRGRVLAREKDALTLRFEIDGDAPPAPAGTELGLAITRRLAQAMGGEVAMAGAPGAESLSWMTLVLHAARAGATRQGPALAEVTTSFAGKHVLIADDDEVNLAVLGDMLTAIGLRCTAVRDGASVVAAAAAPDVDLVFMDVRMPDLDGLGATHRIRESGRDALPIIAVTASAFDEDRRACLAAGMNDFLPKPITLKALRAMLARWLPPAG